MVRREILQDGAVRLSSDRCSFIYRRLRPGVLLMEIAGDDSGEFGVATQDEAAMEFSRSNRPLLLFIDMSEARTPVTKVMEQWTAWFEANRSKLASVKILIPPTAKVLQLTVAIAKHLSGTGELISIHLDPQHFRLALAEMLPERAIR